MASYCGQRGVGGGADGIPGIGWKWESLFPLFAVFLCQPELDKFFLHPLPTDLQFKEPRTCYRFLMHFPAAVTVFSFCTYLGKSVFLTTGNHHETGCK